MRTYLPVIDLKKRPWRVVDADGVVLGRLAVRVANALRGKDRPSFTAHLDGGVFVVVVNAEKVRLTGKKEHQKRYMSYSGWRGGEKYRSVSELRARHPERIITHAVKGMMPKNRLGRRLLTKLKVYRGPGHPHQAQGPSPLAVS